jgi:hypothetical protein
MPYQLCLRAGRLPPRCPLLLASRRLPCMAPLRTLPGNPAYHLLPKALRHMQHARLPTMHSGSTSSSSAV